MQSRKNRIFRQLLATTLLLGGTFNLVAPVMAAGTPAGTSISNTATGTYEDSNNPGVPINATSNTVTITVAEIAGISLTTNATPRDVNGGTIQPGDDVVYEYKITNTGNDATRFYIPDTATVAGGTLKSIRFSYNTDGTGFNPVASGGTTTTSVPVNGVVIVQVTATVNSNTVPGSTLSVQLGNTGTNNNDANTTQNQADSTDTALVGEVRTVDNVGTADGDASAAAPNNGERESSLVQSTPVGDAPRVLNGPKDRPDASGPSSNNDDFTNFSTVIPAGSPQLDQNGNPTRFDPAPSREITNTLSNGSTTDPQTFTLLPTAPADKAALPDGTLVTLKYNNLVAVYQYAQQTGTFTFVTTGSAGGTSTNNPIEVTLQPSAQGSYQVTVDLPSGTPQLANFPVPITAFIDFDNNGAISFTDRDGDGIYDPGEEARPANTTIDRIYTGFLRFVKESRVIKHIGPDVRSGEGEFSTATKNPAPGNIIEYRISYTNISDAAPANATGSLAMDARVLGITEDGLTAPNNWATETNGVIKTSNVPNTAEASAGTISYYSGNSTTPNATRNTTGTTTATDVTKYINNLTAPVAPQQGGSFTIQRLVN